VPLSELAIEIITDLRTRSGDRPHLLPSWQSKLKRDEPLGVRALSRALRNNHDDDGKLFGLEPFTPHDLRRTAASLMTSLRVPRLHVEKVLNHTTGDIAEVYDRHDYAPEKRRALDTWAAELRKIVTSEKADKAPAAPKRRRAS
jgi:integrase